MLSDDPPLLLCKVFLRPCFCWAFSSEARRPDLFLFCVSVLKVHSSEPIPAFHLSSIVQYDFCITASVHPKASCGVPLSGLRLPHLECRRFFKSSSRQEISECNWSSFQQIIVPEKNAWSEKMHAFDGTTFAKMMKWNHVCQATNLATFVDPQRVGEMRCFGSF